MKLLARIVNFRFHRNEEIVICDQCYWSKYVHGWHRCQPRTSVRKSSSAICSAPLVLFLAFVLLAVSAQAQTPAPVTQHFVISATAVAYGDQKGTTAVSEEGTGFQITSNFSVAYARISNPTDSKAPVYNLGAVNYTRELGSLLPTKLKTSLVFDTTNWLVTFQGGAGKVNYEGVNRIAELAGIFLARPVAPNMQITCGYQFLHGAGNTLISRNNSGVPVIGVTFTF